MVDAYCGWFDTRFKGSPENPTDFEVGRSSACRIASFGPASSVTGS